MELHASVVLTWALANLEARVSGCHEIEPTHLFLASLKLIDDAFQREAEDIGLTKDQMSEVIRVASDARRVLQIPDDQVTQLQRLISKRIRHAEVAGHVGMLHRSPQSRELFRLAAASASEEHAPSLTLVHLLTALLATSLPSVADLLPPHLLRRATSRKATPPEGEAPGRGDVHPQSSALGVKSKGVSDEPLGAARSLLASLGRDLTSLALAGRLKPVVGRATELRTIARYLQRTSKRNVLIVGEPGVGKSAVVEGLAMRLSSSSVDSLRRLRIVEISVPQILAGTKYRGDMEERVQRLLEVACSEPDIVLFLDEVHLLFGAGAGSASPLDLASLFKPALARDDFRFIGATTPQDFERYIKVDSAFLRRFQVLPLKEPSEAEALVICTEWARRIEAVQGVIFDDEAIQAAVHLSALLLPARHLPDKALDLLENAATLTKVSSLSSATTIPSKAVPRICRNDIVSALEEQYGISADSAGALSTENVERLLRAEIVGQEEAIASILETLRTLADRPREVARPLGVFLFTGPTGVGKTFAAECISGALFGREPARLGRFNMSEYKERHELARMIGAPPGFIGHEREGALFRYLSTNPQGLVLLDEMEKAHPEIQDYFLQVFDKGQATDSRGLSVDFRRHLFIMTCNVSSELSDRVSIGFRSPTEQSPARLPSSVDKELARYFRGEFLGRVDRIIDFKALEASSFGILLARVIERTNLDLSSQGKARLQLDGETAEQLCRLGVAQGEGARGFLRLLDRRLVTPLRSQHALSSDAKIIEARWSSEGLSFRSLPDS